MNKKKQRVDEGTEVPGLGLGVFPAETHTLFHEFQSKGPVRRTRVPAGLIGGVSTSLCDCRTVDLGQEVVQYFHRVCLFVHFYDAVDC